MYENKRIVYWILFVLFFLLEAIHLFGHLIPAGNPIEPIKPFGHYAPVALVFLLFFVMKTTEREEERLTESATKASELISQLSTESSNVADLIDRTNTMKTEIDGLAKQIRSSDALLHGKLLFFQRQYHHAVLVFEEIYNSDPENTEANKWLGLSLLNDLQPRRAIAHLEAAARSKRNDPELWFAAGKAKFRSRDTRHFESAEEDLRKALQLGLREREMAQVILAKLQLSRDRAAAKATLREALTHNFESYPVIRELSRILMGEQDWSGVIDITDRALAANRRNWGLYPIRAQAFIRRAGAGDFDRARLDINEARSGNEKDFNSLRVEVELLLAQARLSTNSADRRSMMIEALETTKKRQDLFKGSVRAHCLSLRAGISLLLGDGDDAVSVAREAVEMEVPPHPNVHLTYCSALTLRRSWVILSKSAQHMRELFPVAATRCWASLYVALATLFSRETLPAMKAEVAQLVSDLAAYPAFDPTMRTEWIDVAWDFPIAELGAKERHLALLLQSFLLGQIRYDNFMSQIKPFHN